MESATQNALWNTQPIKKGFFYRNSSGGFNRDDEHFDRFGANRLTEHRLRRERVYVGIECKAPKAPTERDQKEFQRQLEAAGGRYILAYSVDDVAVFLWVPSLISSYLQRFFLSRTAPPCYRQRPVQAEASETVLSHKALWGTRSLRVLDRIPRSYGCHYAK